MRAMKVISYNLRKHRAAGELANLVERYGADVLCLQEATPPTSPSVISGLQLADSTQRNRLGPRASTTARTPTGPSTCARWR